MIVDWVWCLVKLGYSQFWRSEFPVKSISLFGVTDVASVVFNVSNVQI